MLFFEDNLQLELFLENGRHSREDSQLFEVDQPRRTWLQNDLGWESGSKTNS
jgi:hypothetical protein